MFFLYRFFILLAAAFIVSSCASKPKTSQASAEWLSSMHRISAAQVEIFPVVADATKVTNPAYKGTIEAALKNLAEGSQDLVQDPKAPNADPIITYTSRRFAQEMRWAGKSYQNGDYASMRTTVLGSTNFCISCHTRADRGAQDYPMPWTPNFAALTRTQLTELLIANRQYKEALKSAETLAADNEAGRQDPLSWRLALTRALAVAVRVKADAGQAKAIVQAMSKNTGIPRHLQGSINSWRKAIDEWQITKTNLSNTQKMSRAKSLITRAGPLDPDQKLIHLLIASGLLHELTEHSNEKLYAEALFLSGTVAEGLKGVDMMGLNQAYYESCIQSVSHTPLAERCYARLENAALEPSFPVELDSDRSILENYLARYRQMAEPKRNTDLTPTKARDFKDSP